MGAQDAFFCAAFTHKIFSSSIPESRQMANGYEKVSQPTVPDAAPPLSTPSLSLSGQSYIVTGGTQGLGLEIAKQLKACGAAKLALLSRSRDKGEAVAKELSDD